MTDYQLHLLSTTPAITGQATFPRDFAGFQGHFPQSPILPAFMQVQAAIDLLHAAGLPSTLHHLENARFSRPIRPDELMHLQLTPDAAGHFDAQLSVTGEPCSRFTLHMAAS